MSGEHPSRRAVTGGMIATALAAATRGHRVEAAEVKKEMTWLQAVAAFRDDMRRGAVEQSAHIARTGDARSFVFHARKGLIASVPADPQSDQRALATLLLREQDVTRVGVFHQHQHTAIDYGARASGVRIQEAHQVNLRGQIIKKGRDLTSAPQSSPFSVDDIEHSALDSTYGLALTRADRSFDVVHGVFDPFGLWYYEMAGPAHLPHLTPEQNAIYVHDLAAAERIQKQIAALSTQTLRILTRALSQKIKRGHIVDIPASAAKDEIVGEVLLVLSHLYNRGILPSRLIDIRSILRHNPDTARDMEIYFVEQQKRVEAVDAAFAQLRVQSALLGRPPDADIQAFQDASFRAWGALSRFVPYEAIPEEQPLAGVFKN